MCDVLVRATSTKASFLLLPQTPQIEQLTPRMCAYMMSIHTHNIRAACASIWQVCWHGVLWLVCHSCRGAITTPSPRPPHTLIFRRQTHHNRSHTVSVHIKHPQSKHTHTSYPPTQQHPHPHSPQSTNTQNTTHQTHIYPPLTITTRRANNDSFAVTQSRLRAHAFVRRTCTTIIIFENCSAYPKPPPPTTAAANAADAKCRRHLPPPDDDSTRRHHQQPHCARALCVHVPNPPWHIKCALHTAQHHQPNEREQRARKRATGRTTLAGARVGSDIMPVWCVVGVVGARRRRRIVWWGFVCAAKRFQAVHA